MIPAEVYGAIPANETEDSWRDRTAPFREAVFAANNGRPVDKIFEHTGGTNFPLLVSALAENGTLAFFGATGSGLKGEYKETFFYAGQRLIMDARWVWMRQKQILFRSGSAQEILAEIGLAPGKKGLIWGADGYAREFVKAALARSAEVAVIASHSREAAGIAELIRLGVKPAHIIDRDRFQLAADMPDPLTADGHLNPAYNSGYMNQARALGPVPSGAIFGPRTSPDFVIERSDQSHPSLQQLSGP